jgi:cytidylate kinase
MIIVIHGPAGSGKTSACKLLIKKYFLNRAVYYDIDRITQAGTQPQRCQQVVDIIGIHQYLYRDFHFFINWVFENPRIALDFMGKLSQLNAQQEVKGLILNARHEVRMKRLLTRADWQTEQAKSAMADQNIEDQAEAWAEMGLSVDTSDDTVEQVAKKMVNFLKLS